MARAPACKVLRDRVHRASFADSLSSRDPARQDRVALRVRARNLAGPANSAVVRIRPAPRAVDSRRVLEWAEHRDCRLRECRPNRPADRERLHGVRDSAISTGLKKAR